MNLQLRLDNIDETRNYFLKEIKQHELMIEKHKKVSININYTEHFLIECFFCFFAWHSQGNYKFFKIGLKIFAIVSEYKKYKWIIQKGKIKYDKIILLAKPKLNSIGVLISKVLIDSVISHYEFVL